MTTLRAAVQAARTRLLNAGTVQDDIEAEIEAEVLLRHAIDPASTVTKAYLYTRYADLLDAAVAVRYEALLERRLSHQPTAYIIGHREFHGLDFRVTPAVLIPRPETELLVDTVVELAQANPPNQQLRIVDIGTGSGAIAVCLAKAFPGAEIYATDVSRPALQVAKDNARRHAVRHRIAFRCGDLLTPLAAYVDFIVANLPYVSTADWTQLPSELRDHEPRLALDGGSDGLDAIRLLLRQAFRYLPPHGRVLLEIGEDQDQTVSQFLRDTLSPTVRCEVRRDFQDIPRVMILTAS